MKPIHIDNLTEAQAYLWLLENDKEGIELWKTKEYSGELVEAVRNNITDFGEDGFHENGVAFLVTLEHLKRFLVTATVENDLYTFVMARDEDHARELAQDVADSGGMFEEKFGGDFKFSDIYESDEDDGQGDALLSPPIINPLIEYAPKLLEALEGVLNHLWDDRPRSIKNNFSLMNHEAYARKIIHQLKEKQIT